MMFTLLDCGNASAVVPQQRDLLNLINQAPNDGGQPQADGTLQQPIDGTATVGSPLGLSPSSWTIGPPGSLPRPPPVVGPAQRAGAHGPQSPLVVTPQSPPMAGPAQRAGAGTRRPRPPWVLPQLTQVIPGMSPADRNALNRLLIAVFDLIEMNGVPRSLRPGGGGGPPPNPSQIFGGAVLFSQRTPMIMQALLRSLWPGGTSYKHAPDAWIISRLWSIIREYDTNGTILTYHLNHQHELPGGLQNASHLNTSHACDCWTERLGQGWDNRTAAGEMAMLPQGMQREPPDKLKRLLTAVLDEYVKSHDSFLRRNPWINNRDQPYYWALWTKPFVRAFLQLKGVHNLTNGQYWYLLDEDATTLGYLTGYDMQHIHSGVFLWRQFELHNAQAHGQPQPPAGLGAGLPPAPAPAAALAGRPPPPRGTRLAGPDDYFLIDQLLIPHFLRDINFKPKNIPSAQRDAMWAQTTTLRLLHFNKQRYNQLSTWCKPTTRGLSFVRFGEKRYDARADMHGAPHLATTWSGQNIVNEAWLKEAIDATIWEADQYRRRNSGRPPPGPWPGIVHPPFGPPLPGAPVLAMRNFNPRNRVPPPPALANVQPPQGPTNVQPAPPGIQQNVAQGNIVPLQEFVPPPLGPPLTLEEIYLIATAINETQNADQLQSNVIHLVIEQLRVPVVRTRIRQRIQLFAFQPRNASQHDMNLDLWRFDLWPQGLGGINPNPPPPPPSPPPGSSSRGPPPHFRSPPSVPPPQPPPNNRSQNPSPQGSNSRAPMQSYQSSYSSQQSKYPPWSYQSSSTIAAPQEEEYILDPSTVWSDDDKMSEDE